MPTLERPSPPAQLAHGPTSPSRRRESTRTTSFNASVANNDDFLAYTSRRPPLDPRQPPARNQYPSPLPEQALQSAKLAALHARLLLPKKLPLQTLARALVDPSADESPRFNNINLAFVGSTLINYYTSEHLMCRYPRLPMLILHAAVNGYAGDKSLYSTSKAWGVETVAHPGDEVDPGMLQFSPDRPSVRHLSWGYERTEAAYINKFKWRHSISSRVVFDDAFGQMVQPNSTTSPSSSPKDSAPDYSRPQPGNSTSYYGGPDPPSYTTKLDRYAAAVAARANSVRAVVGALYAHCGREPAKAFVRAHILSRWLDIAELFEFRAPTRELAMLCARENLPNPTARLEAESGRRSIAPVFVVGIYCGRDKLSEGHGSSLDHARYKAAINALKTWYLYSPGADPPVPSETMNEGARPWRLPYVDIGEIVPS